MNLTKICTDIDINLTETKWSHTSDAIKKITEKWKDQKEGLYNILSKHPNWDEDKMAIIFKNESINRPFDKTEVIKFCDYVTELNEELGQLLFSTFVKKALSSKITVDQCNAIKEKFPDIKLNPGLKTSRAFNKICSGVKEVFENSRYNHQFAILSDAINPNTEDVILVMSIHPCDCLNMSRGNSWVSCHDIRYGNLYDWSDDINNKPEEYDDPECGCYCAGTMSYMLDDVSMVIYTIPIDTDLTESIYQIPKITRQICAYSQFEILHSRIYPANGDRNNLNIYQQYRLKVQNVLAECLGVDSDWRIGDSCGSYKNIFIKDEDAVCYPDWKYVSYKNLCKVSVHKSLITDEENYKDNLPQITVGAAPICVKCGETHTREDFLLCYDC